MLARRVSAGVGTTVRIGVGAVARFGIAGGGRNICCTGEATRAFACTSTLFEPPALVEGIVDAPVDAPGCCAIVCRQSRHLPAVHWCGV